MSKKNMDITELRKSGMSLMDIAMELNVPVSVVASTLHEEGAIGANAKYLDKTEHKIKVIALRKSGMKLRDIATEVGAVQKDISKFLRKETHQDWWDEYDAETAESKRPVIQKATKLTTNKAGVLPKGSKVTRLPKEMTMPRAKVNLLNEDKYKEIVRDSLAKGMTYKAIEESTGIKYDNVRNFALKVTYADWWAAQPETVDVDKTAKAKTAKAKTAKPTPSSAAKKSSAVEDKTTLASNDVKLRVISYSQINNMSAKLIASKMNMNEKAVAKFLSKKTYTSWWEKHEASMLENAQRAREVLGYMLEDVESASEDIEQGGYLDGAVSKSLKALGITGAVAAAIVLGSLAVNFYFF